MSLKTIHCQLFADESVRKHLWELMVVRNTPLVNELLRLVALHPDFEKWRRKGKLPSKEVTDMAKVLKIDPRFKQPAKFSISAEKTAIYTFESWLAIQQGIQKKIDGKISWLRMLRTDDELVADCGQDIEIIRQKAQSLIVKYQPSANPTESNKDFRNNLYKIYDETENLLTRSAIAYLLKNHNKIPSENNEDSDKRLEHRQKIEVQIKILTQQLESRLPRGRDLTGARFLNTLELATHTISVDVAQARQVKQRKEQKNTKILQGMEKKEELTPNQTNFIQRTQANLDKLSRTFTRPSKPLYAGKANIMVAVSMGLEHPATVVAIDLKTQTVLAYLSTKQLLGENYRLLNQQRNLQRKQRQQNHKAQKQGLPRQLSNSSLGEYIDRLLAKAIVNFAQSHNATSISLPKLDDIRITVQSEIDAKAQAKIPGFVDGQKKYARQVRINLHNWSYGRLRDSIVNKAAEIQISIEHGDCSFKSSPIEQAQAIAMSAYANRKA